MNSLKTEFSKKLGFFSNPLNEGLHFARSISCKMQES